MSRRGVEYRAGRVSRRCGGAGARTRRRFGEAARDCRVRAWAGRSVCFVGRGFAGSIVS